MLMNHSILNVQAMMEIMAMALMMTLTMIAFTVIYMAWTLKVNLNTMNTMTALSALKMLPLICILSNHLAQMNLMVAAPGILFMAIRTMRLAVVVPMNPNVDQIPEFNSQLYLFPANQSPFPMPRSIDDRAVQGFGNKIYTLPEHMTGPIMKVNYSLLPEIINL